MTKQEKLEHLNTPSIAYWSGCNGLEIKKIEFGIEDFVIYTINNRYNRANLKVKKAKLRYNGKGAFFISNGYRVNLGDCIKM